MWVFVCVKCVCVKDDPKGRVYFIFSGRVPQQIGVAHMKTKTTGIPFTDYNVNTTRVLSLALILSLIFSQGVIKPQYSTRGTLFIVTFSPARPIDSFTVFSNNFNERKAILFAFTTRHVLTFIQLSIFADHQKFPFGRYTRDARDDPNRTRCPNRRELL